MIKKISLITLAILLISGVAFAGTVNNEHSSTQYSGAIIWQGPRDIDEPLQIVVPVRYSSCEANETSIASGAALIWDTNSADGVSVTKALGTDGDLRFAGIAVTTLLTQDSGSLDADDNWGMMCIKGYCLASMDSSTTIGSETAALGVSDGGGLTDVANVAESKDVATLLQTSSAGQKHPVWIK